MEAHGSLWKPVEAHGSPRKHVNDRITGRPYMPDSGFLWQEKSPLSASLWHVRSVKDSSASQASGNRSTQNTRRWLRVAT